VIEHRAKHQSDRSTNPVFAIVCSAAGVSISIEEVVCPDTGTLLGICQVEQVEHPGIVNSITASPANPNRFGLASIFLFTLAMVVVEFAGCAGRIIGTAVSASMTQRTVDIKRIWADAAIAAAREVKC